MVKDKELSIKDYFVYTLLVLCALGFWYFGIVFVTLEFNFLNWSNSTRFLFLAEGVFTAIGLVMLKHVSSN